jgi:NDP-sugar pyrophosphorylase family protein
VTSSASGNDHAGIVGVILAAGRGTRLHPLTLDYPKPLLPICNKPILRYQLESLQRAGVREVYVVVGHLKEQVGRVLAQSEAELGLRVHQVDQESTLGIAHALLQLEAHVDAPMLVLLGDIFLVAPRLPEMIRMLQREDVSGVLGVKRESDPSVVRRNFAVHLRADGSVGQVVEKPRAVRTDLKGTGVYLFRPEFFDALRRTPRTALRDEYEITDSIQLFIDQGHAVYPAEVIERDVNITLACDLLQCNLTELACGGAKSSGRLPDGVTVRDSLLGKDVRLAPGTVVERSVLGSGVVVERSIEIRDCVVFSGAHVKEAGILEYSLVTGGLRLHCNQRGP